MSNSQINVCTVCDIVCAPTPFPWQRAMQVSSSVKKAFWQRRSLHTCRYTYRIIVSHVKDYSSRVLTCINLAMNRVVCLRTFHLQHQLSICQFELMFYYLLYYYIGFCVYCNRCQKRNISKTQKQTVTLEQMSMFSLTPLNISYLK